MSGSDDTHVREEEPEPRSEPPWEPPPAAPGIRRRLKVKPLQMLGFAFLATMPTLALAGVFGESRARAEAGGADLHVDVRYPERFRYKQINDIIVRLDNRGGQSIDTVSVAFDTAYVTRFSNPLFIPSAVEPFRVQVTDLRPGAQKLVLAKLQAERYGRHRGELRITTTRGDTLSVSLSTFVFP